MVYQSYSEFEMKLQTCRICLATGVKMSNIGEAEVKKFLENIFKSNGFTQDLDERHYACFECKALLYKSYNFIQRSLRAQQAMYKILEQYDSVNTAALKSIDRCALGLISTLSYHQVGIDYHINDEENTFQATMGEVFDTKEGISKVSATLNSDTDAQQLLQIEIKVKEEIADASSDGMQEFADPITFASEIEVPVTFTKPVIKKEKKLRIKKERVEDKERKVPIKKRTRKKKNPGKIGRPRIHFEIDDREYPRKCDHCNYIVDEKKIHYKHYLFCHPNEEYPYHIQLKYMCQFCGISKRTDRRLRDHELTHGEKNVECPDCKRKFHNHTQLYRHNQRVHVDRNLLVCDYCHKGFKVKSELILHIRTHTGEKPFKCDICGAAFAHRGNVGVHVRNVHQKDAPQRKLNNKTRNLANYTPEYSYGMDYYAIDPSCTPSTMDTV